MSSRMLVCIVLMALVASCGDPVGETQLLVIQELGFGSRTGDEIGGMVVAQGLDVDQRVSDRTDSETCNTRDFVSPEGIPGVDNQFTFLYDAVVGFFQDGTVEGIVQGSINEGRLLLMLEVVDVDDTQQDEDVTVNLFLGEGRPDIGADGLIVPAQTFDRRTDAETVAIPGRIVDGVLEAGPFDAIIPMAFFDVFFDLDLHGARLRAEQNDDGSWSGMIGGGVEAETLINVAREADMRQEIQVTAAIMAILPGYLDLGYDPETRRCTQISAALQFRATSAFLYDAPAVAADDPLEDPE